MAIAKTDLLTYEQYMAEGEVFERYDIIDGVRIVANPTRRHQKILMRLNRFFLDYQDRSHAGEALLAPCDVLIRRNPLRTRQPDMLFISHAQLAKCSHDDDPAPLFAAPELVVEILSPSETLRTRTEKIEDYRSIGVRECWVVSPDLETVEVLRLSASGVESVATYSRDQSVTSISFPGLELPVAAIFHV